MQLAGVHPSFPEVLQGLALLFAALPISFRLWRKFRPARAVATTEVARA
jgi:hypothetical protein